MMEFIFTFDDGKKIPYYHQLYQFVRQEIESGRTIAGTRLPSIRNLSDSLAVSKTTVEQAYQQLIAEGYIGSAARVGYFSLPQEHTFARPDVHHPQDLQNQISRWNNIDIDFHPARVDVEYFPFSTLRKISHAVWNTFDHTTLDYGDPLGERGLRTQIARYLLQSRGVVCSPDQVIVGSGIQYSLQLLVGLLGIHNMHVAMEYPGYDRVRSIFAQLQVPIDPIPLESDGIDVKSLSSSTANVAYVTPSHQYPQGMVMSYSKRMQLLEWAKARRGLIIEDDYDGEFRYGERPIPALQGLDTDERVIYVGTFSKALAPSFRMNYMVLPSSLLKKFTNQPHYVDSPVSRFQQLLIEKFMEMGHFERHIRRTRRVYRHKHAVLLQSIRSELGSYATVKGYGAGLHVSIELCTDYSQAELIERAASAGVSVYFSSEVPIAGDAPSVNIILGFGGLSAEQITDGIRRLRSCWFSSDH
jgi:GntR family transcriptional regulator / MocR family aminotransferase